MSFINCESIKGDIIINMSLLFSISNFLVPFTLLIYRNSRNIDKEIHLYYGQIFLIIIATIITNLFYYVFSTNFIFVSVDFIVKMIITFLPASLNNRIEKKISYMHFEILIEKFRSHLVEYFYIFHEFVTQWGISKMDEIEQKQFKFAIIDNLNKNQKKVLNRKEKTLGFASQLQNAYKHFENTGITCNILNVEMFEKIEKDHEKDKMKLRLYMSQKKAQNKVVPTKDEKVSTEQKLEGSQINMKKKKNTFTLQKSSSDLFNEDQEVPTTSNLKGSEEITSPPTKQKINFKTYPKRFTEDLSNKTSSFQSSDHSEILNKLDASQFSDLFEEEQPLPEEKKLVCKVQAIIQISHPTGSRLEIYNIQLYSNDDLRIVSLYGKEFEKHKIVGLKQQRYGYYELQLKEGKVEKRKVKFRGNMQPFKKYSVDL